MTNALFPEPGSFLSIAHIITHDMHSLSNKTKFFLIDDYKKVINGAQIVEPLVVIVDSIVEKTQVIAQWSEQCIAIEHADFTAEELNNLFETMQDIKSAVDTGLKLEDSLALKYQSVCEDQFLRGRLRSLFDDANKLMLHISAEDDKLYFAGH